MLNQARWEEVRRLYFQERWRVAAIARHLDLDRKTVRGCIRGSAWQPYRRSARQETVLSEHADWLRARASEVCYSAQILYQELRTQRGYRGSYETVKLFVRPLREAAELNAQTQVRFETGPGQQSQVDWGQMRTHFRHQPVSLHAFVLTLGFSRRGYYGAYANEQLGAFLDAHERAFEHFGGLTREHLYDRPRTVCRPGPDRRVEWNPTFLAFAHYWGFEPRLCRAYRAQTKGKVESGVKYLKRNFLPGRTFIDQNDFDAQLAEWMATIADVRVHGTVHERPIDRFERECGELLPSAGRAPFRAAVPVARIVADDYLVSFETNRYSVPATLIGKTVEVRRRDGGLEIVHRGATVARHPLLAGRHQMRILPEHGPGAIARNARQRRSTLLFPPGPRHTLLTEVEVRDLGFYDQIAGAAAQVSS
jgi:transposase